MITKEDKFRIQKAKYLHEINKLAYIKSQAEDPDVYMSWNKQFLKLTDEYEQFLERGVQ